MWRLLAVLKVNGAYVPLDPGDRHNAFNSWLTDADMAAVVSMAAFGEKLRDVDVRRILPRRGEAGDRRQATDAAR